MRLTNLVKQKVRAHHKVVGSFVTLACPSIAEIMAHSGFDFLIVDLEHGAIDMETAQAILQAMSDSESVPFVRVAVSDEAQIKRALEIGPWGIIAPHIRSQRAAEQFVSYTRYPPSGIRAVSAGRAAKYGLWFDQYMGVANQEILTVALVEDTAAVEDIDGIAGTNGLDWIFVGPYDLAASMGMLNDRSNPNVTQALEHVRSRTQAVNKVAGIYADNGRAAHEFLQGGWDFVVLSEDVALFCGVCSDILNQLRG